MRNVLERPSNRSQQSAGHADHRGRSGVDRPPAHVAFEISGARRVTGAQRRFATVTSRSLRSETIMEPAMQSGGTMPQPDDHLQGALPVAETAEFGVPALVCEIYRESPPPLRARLLECLLRPVRPLPLVAIAAGAFGAFLHRESWSRVTVSIEDALRFSAEQVFELARYVEQFQPETFRQVASLMAENPVTMTTLSGSLLLMALRRWLTAPPADR
jgi:hypothetical protein